jgi:hypothetical protein
MHLLQYNYLRPLIFEGFLLMTFVPYYKKFFRNDLQPGKPNFALEDLLLLNQLNKSKVDYFIGQFIELASAF